MGDRAQIMSSFGGRQGPDSEQIEQSFGGGGNSGVNGPVLNIFKAAVARVKAGTGRGRILVIGDSTTLGEGGGNDTSSPYDANAVSNSTGYNMAYQLAALGIPTNPNGIFADGGCGNYNDTAYSVFNPQFANGGMQSLARSGYPTAQTLGGGPFLTATVGNYFTFKPPGNSTKFRMWLAQSNPVYGSYQYVLDGGTTQTLNVPQLPTGQFAAYLLEVSAARGFRNLSMNFQSGGQLRLLAGYAIDETVPAIDVLVAGNRGSKVSDWINTNGGTVATRPDSPLGMISTIGADLVLGIPPINDAGAGTDIATFTANLTTFVQAAKAAGSDVALVNATDTNAAAGGGQNNRSQYLAAMTAVTQQQNIPLIDLQPQYSWNATDWRDNLHAFKKVYGVAGAYLGNQLFNYTK